jgi:hypothetical protein
MTDYKQLCAELVNRLEGLYDELVDSEMGWVPPEAQELMTRAHAALAEPEPEVPTDEELDELFTEIDQSGEPESWRAYARAVLARWGNHPGSPDSSTPQPVTVSERLPGDELCWWYEPDEDDGYGGMWTLLRIRGGTARYSHWLPAHALPQPS